MNPNPDPVVTTPELIQRRSGYQALEPVKRPPHWGVDRDPARRPGVPMMRTDPQPLPNARFPPERQRGTPASPRHGRPNKPMPPVFGTALPPRGLSGAIRKLAYRYPDHKPRHWLLKMLGDRVDSWTTRARRLLVFAVPIAAIALIFRRARA
jgi:hypothetical protein